MNFNDTYKALLREAQFTNEILGAGTTQIRYANFARQGIYFQAFTSLSTGLERIGKLCLMLDYYIDNNLDFVHLVDKKGRQDKLISPTKEKSYAYLASRDYDSIDAI